MTAARLAAAGIVGLWWLGCRGAALAADAGSCAGCAGRDCAIAGQLFDTGAAKAAEPCQICAPASSPTGWTAAPDGTACAPGSVCASGVCRAGCFIDGFYRESDALDPADGCQSCRPAMSAGAWTPVGDGTRCSSDGGTFCAAGACLPLCDVGGLLVAEGTADAGAPGACCNVAESATAWSPGFSAGVPAQTALEPAALAAGDVDGNGTVDLVVAHPGPGTVGVLTGLGNGSFAAERIVGTGDGPRALLLADFDRDGRLDLAVANGGGGTVDVLLQQADGSFAEAPGAPLLTPGLGPTAVAAGDLDGNGTVDLVVADQGTAGDAGPGEVAAFLGNGDGTFQPPIPEPVGSEPVALILADVDGDGTLDLVTADAAAKTLTVLSGIDGGFAEPPLAQLACPAVPLAVAAVDLTGDGFPELVAATERADGGALVIFENAARAPWFPGAPVSLPAGPGVAALAGGELAEGGRRDLAVVEQGADSVAVFIQASMDGGLAFAPPVRYSVGHAPSALVAADFDGDGLVDLAASDTGGSMVSLLLGNCR